MHRKLHGPKSWLLSTIVGAMLGLALAYLMPATPPPPGEPAAHLAAVVVQIKPDGSKWVRSVDGSLSPAPKNPAQLLFVPPTTPASATARLADPVIPLALCIPFAILLISIAVMPFISERFWHHHYPDFALLLGSLVAAYYLAAFGHYGSHTLTHVIVEYYSFIAIVAGLFVCSGGILIQPRARGTPLANTLLLAFGAVIANIVGTTGASVLLIRPFIRMNQGRLRPIHIVFFILIVSNCGGCLTPIGDPPLYLGFLKGVPFTWTFTHLWPHWLTVVSCLLALFVLIDARIPRVAAPEPAQFTDAPLLSGWPSIVMLLLVVAAVFVDPFLSRFGVLKGLPVGATIQLLIAAAAYAIADPAIRRANAFTFAPVKEVGFLFIGIFLTMAPALGYLQANGSHLGLETPTQFYFLTGSLSAVLDNAPTYLSFLQAAFGVLHLPLNAEGIHIFTHNVFDIYHADGTHIAFEGQSLLEAISLGAVFFGAMTYIGNGPNFMVKSIVDSGRDEHGVRMPSFFGYTLYAIVLLLPVLILVWFIFIR